jgi:hypothetical protein
MEDAGTMEQTQERLSRNLRRNGKVCKQTVDKTKKSARIRYV